MKVRELLSDESKWCKGVDAKDENGNDTNPTCPNAIRWCLMGAIQKCYPLEFNVSKRVDIYNAIKEKLSLNSYTSLDNFLLQLTRWNDLSARTFAEVKALVDELDI